MRRRIKLTGRKDIPFNAFSLECEADTRAIQIDIEPESIFKTFETDASVVVQMTENKFTEYLRFGTIANLEQPKHPEHDAFRAPSCQLRVVSNAQETLGLVLGSSNSWTLQIQPDENDNASGEGILLFQPDNIAPRTWKLDIRDDEHPVLYVDEQIPEPTDWARRDPTFRSVAMPAVVERVMHHLLANVDNMDYDWAKEWLKWAGALLPNQNPPIGSEQAERDLWIGRLVDEFCRQNRFHDSLLSQLIKVD